jgi:hypothetical protein
LEKDWAHGFDLPVKISKTNVEEERLRKRGKS